MNGHDWARRIFERAREGGAQRILCDPDELCSACQALRSAVERVIPDIQAEAAAFERVRLVGALETILRQVEQRIEAADRDRDWRVRADGLASRAILEEALDGIRDGTS
ncbi:MAG TPA: hypothetical protein VNE16_13850 [Vicinamibacterales bacterium]|nr:hypothetical protein [Vicinamibacterales bacterium]